jgi:hypothetical protein
LLGKKTQGLFRTFEEFEFRAAITDRKNTLTFVAVMVKKLILPFSCQGDIVGRVSAHYIALLIFTNLYFCAFTIQAHSTANGKFWREIQNTQMFETDPESFSPAIYFNFNNGVCIIERRLVVAVFRHSGHIDTFLSHVAGLEPASFRSRELHAADSSHFDTFLSHASQKKR